MYSPHKREAAPGGAASEGRLRATLGIECKCKCNHGVFLNFRIDDELRATLPQKLDLRYTLT